MQGWRLVVVLFAVGLSAAAQTAPPPTPPPPPPPHPTEIRPNMRLSISALDQAEAAIAERDFRKAERLLLPLVEVPKPDPRAVANLAYAYSMDGAPELAIANYRRAMTLKPGDFQITFNLALLLIERNDPEGEQLLRTAITLDASGPARARAWIALGQLLEPRDAKGAIDAFREAIKLDRKSPEPHVLLALTFEKQKDFAAAEEAITGALARDPKHANALAVLVNVAIEAEHLPQAEIKLRELVGRDKGNVLARVQLGRVLAFQNKRDEAIKELEAVVGESHDLVALSDLADLHLHAGQVDQAIAEYQELVAREPDTASARLLLGKALMAKKDFAEAENTFSQVLELDPRLLDAYLNLAASAMENQHYSVVIHALDARSTYSPETAETHFLRASAYDRLTNFTEAAQSYREFLRLSGGLSPAQESKARERLAAITQKK